MTTGLDPIATPFGGGGALASYVALASNFQSGLDFVRNAVSGDDTQHVVTDVQLIDGIVYGGGYLAGVKAAVVGAAQGLIGPSDPSVSALLGFVNAANGAGFAAGALYGLNQDLAAHAPPIIGLLEAIPSALQTVQNDFTSTADDAASLVTALNNLPNETVDQVVGDYQPPVVPTDEGNSSATGNTTVTPLIPAETAYYLTVSGTAYEGTTNFLSSSTQLIDPLLFTLSGELVVAPTIDSTNVAGNGVNDRDVVVNTGNTGVGGTGVMNFATNTALSTLFGGGYTQTAGLDVAYVSVDPNAGTIHIQLDANTAGTAPLNELFHRGGYDAIPYEITTGYIDLTFSNGGASVSGTLVLAGQSEGLYPGTAAIKATIVGTLAN